MFDVVLAGHDGTYVTLLPSLAHVHWVSSTPAASAVGWTALSAVMTSPMHASFARPIEELRCGQSR